MVPPMQKPVMPTLPTPLTASMAACVSRSIAGQSALPTISRAFRDVVGRVAGLEILLHAIEHRRRDRHIACVGQPIGHRADVVIDAENFLDHDHCALRRALRIGAVGAELEAVRRRERHILSHERYPF